MSADLPLGKPTPYPEEYAPGVLVGIAREEGRRVSGIAEPLPFRGVDVWNAHELSWLDPRGKPRVARAELRIPASSPSLVESKSLKLYLGSLNGARHTSAEDVRRVIAEDVGAIVGSELDVRIVPPNTEAEAAGVASEETCIDGEDVAIDTYRVDRGLLALDARGDEVEETLVSNLLRSTCPVTGQPDWGTVLVRYRGARIERRALLRYIVSYRQHDAFHEDCVERMFVDLLERCGPSALSVMARYARRGGIDINPFRSNFEDLREHVRAWRQ